MKKVFAKILCVALVMVLGLGVMSLLAPSAAAASSTPVVALRASDAINPILDIYLYREKYGTGGPFTVEFEWKCTLQRGLDATKQNTPSCFVGVEGYDETAERQPSTDIKMYQTTDWNKQSFQFNNVGFCYEAGNVMAANNRVRFGMWYFKGELCIKNLKITNAAGEVMYDMNADPDILQLIAQMEADNLTETDLGNLAAINRECAFAAAKFGEGSYTAHIFLESKGGNTPTEPDGPVIETEPPATNPPATNPPATEPPATEPPATEPPVTNPPATDPTETNPPATNPPATDPTETNPPASDPAETNPPATQAPTQPNAGNNGSNGGVNPVILILIGAVLVVGGVLIVLILTGKIGGGKKEEQ